MSLFGRGMLPEGYYEEDDYGVTRIEDSQRIYELQKEGKLFENDGYSFNKVSENETIRINKTKYQDE